MKKSLRNLVLLLLVSPFLMQCATQTEVEELRYQLRIVNKKIDDMRSTTVGQLQKGQAATTGQLDQLEQEILTLKNQLDDTYHINQRLSEQNKELETAISTVAQEEATKREQAMKRLEELEREKEAKLAEINQQLQQQQENVKAIQEARLKEAERKALEAALAAEMARSKTVAASNEVRGSGPIRLAAEQKKSVRDVTAEAPQPAADPVSPSPQPTAPPPVVEETAQQAAPAVAPPPPAAAAPPVVADPLQDAYSRAKQLFDSGKYGDALVLFEQVASEGAGDEAIEGRFMTGEALFNMKEYDKAIMQYQKIISQYPSHNLSPAAMLQQGIAFENLADKDTAKVIYRKLLSRHSATPEASQAEERLGKL
jgi:TolA-binding protein